MEVELLATIMDRHLPAFAMSKPVPITLHHTVNLDPAVFFDITSLQQGSLHALNSNALSWVIKPCLETLCYAIRSCHCIECSSFTHNPSKLSKWYGIPERRYGTCCKEKWFLQATAQE